MAFVWDSDLALKYNYFDLCSYRNSLKIYSRCIDIIDQVDLLQMSSHEKRVSYLDLAVEPNPRNTRGDHARFEMLRNLPPAVAEYLTAESRIPSSLENMLTYLSHYRQMRFVKNDIDRVNLARQWYVQFLEIFRLRLSLMGDFQWPTYFRRLLNVYRLLQINGIFQHDLERWMRYVTRPRDSELTIEFMNTVFGNNNRLKYLSFHFIPPVCLEPLIFHAKIIGFDFWGLWRGMGPDSAVCNPVSEYIYAGENELAEILIRYGFPHPPMVRHYHTYPRNLVENRAVFNVFILYVPQHLHFDLKLLLGSARPRLMMYTVIAFMRDTDAAARAQRTLALLMRSVPDPYILPSEIRDVLGPFFLHFTFVTLQQITDVYQDANLFGVDEPLTVLRPRTLMHLSRCVVRKALADNLRVPEGILQLPVPRVIKNYLLLRS